MGTDRPPSVIEITGRRLAASAVLLFGRELSLTILVLGSLGFAVVVFAVYGVILVVLDDILDPSPEVATVLSLTWFVGSLVTMFLFFRRGYRWINAALELPARIVDAIDPSLVRAADPAAPDAPDSATLAQRLAAADARLATPGSATTAARGREPPSGAPQEPG